MTKYAYSPHTNELILTDNPAEWMGITSVAPPDFDPVTSGCFWRGDHWEIVESVQPSNPVPEVVSMRQARLALLGAGLLEQINTAIANAEGIEGEAGRIEWEYAQEVRRDSLLVAGLSAALELSEESLDNLFTAASTL